MGEGTAGADLDPSAVLFGKGRVPGTIFKMIERAVTEQTVNALFFFYLVAGIILAVPVLKIFI